MTNQEAEMLAALIKQERPLATTNIQYDTINGVSDYLVIVEWPNHKPPVAIRSLDVWQKRKYLVPVASNGYHPQEESQI